GRGHWFDPSTAHHSETSAEQGSRKFPGPLLFSEWSLPREHDPVRDRRAGPAVRPGAIVEIESRVTAVVVKGGVDGERAGIRIEFQHEQTIFPVARHCQPMGAGVIARPVRGYGWIKHDAGDLDRVSAVVDVHHYDPVQYRHALDQVMGDDAGHAAEGAWELPDQLRPRMIARNVSDPLDPATGRLNVDRAVRSATSLLGVNLAVAARWSVEVIRRQALEVVQPE